MLEVGKKYAKTELSEIFGTKDRQGLDRKMERYGIEFMSSGRGEQSIYEIQQIHDPFRIYAITDLSCDGNTNTQKLRTYYWHYFNDEIFRAMPDEVKETMLKLEDKGISRQTIATYTRKLINKNMIELQSNEFIYYFAFKGEQRLVERSEYSQAWREYWNAKRDGADYYEVIYGMIDKYGGVARKQAIPQINGIYNTEIDYMCSLIQESMENEV